MLEENIAQDTFGSLLLKYRSKTRLSQVDLGELLGVSGRSVGKWETSSAYPADPEMVKKLITLFVEKELFTEGRELQEAKKLWKLSRQKLDFDYAWFSSLLTLPSSPISEGQLQAATSLTDPSPSSPSLTQKASSKKQVKLNIKLIYLVGLALLLLIILGVFLTFNSTLTQIIIPRLELEVKEGISLVNTTQSSKLFYSIAFSPNGKYMATASQTKPIEFWKREPDGISRDTNPLTPLSEDTLNAYWLSYSGDGRLMVSGHSNGYVKLWQTGDTQLPIKLLTTIKSGIDGKVIGVIDNSGTWLAHQAPNNQIRLVNLTSNEEKILGSDLSLERHTDKVREIVFNKSSQFLASVGLDGKLIIWDVATGKPVMSSKQHTGAAYTVVFNPANPNVLATGGVDKTVRLWDITNNKLSLIKTNNPLETKDEIYSLSFSSDGQLLAAASKSTFITVWNVATAKELLTLNNHKTEVYIVAFAPQKLILASGSSGTQPTLIIRELSYLFSIKSKKLLSFINPYPILPLHN